jgi:hypothetical protein
MQNFAIQEGQPVKVEHVAFLQAAQVIPNHLADKGRASLGESCGEFLAANLIR